MNTNEHPPFDRRLATIIALHTTNPQQIWCIVHAVQQGGACERWELIKANDTTAAEITIGPAMVEAIPTGTAPAFNHPDTKATMLGYPTTMPDIHGQHAYRIDGARNSRLVYANPTSVIDVIAPLFHAATGPTDLAKTETQS